MDRVTSNNSSPHPGRPLLRSWRGIPGPLSEANLSHPCCARPPPHPCPLVWLVIVIVRCAVVEGAPRYDKDPPVGRSLFLSSTSLRIDETSRFKLPSFLWPVLPFHPSQHQPLRKRPTSHHKTRKYVFLSLTFCCSAFSSLHTLPEDTRPMITARKRAFDDCYD